MRRHGLQWPWDKHQARAASAAGARGRGHLARATPTARRQQRLPPGHPQFVQVGAWVLFGFLSAGVYIFYLPFVGSAATQLGLVVVYSLLVLVVLVLGYVTRCARLEGQLLTHKLSTHHSIAACTCSAADPSDPALTDSSSDGEYYCTICQVRPWWCTGRCAATGPRSFRFAYILNSLPCTRCAGICGSHQQALPCLRPLRPVLRSSL